MKVEESEHDANIIITCQDNNKFTPETPDWPQCVTSKINWPLK